MTIGRVEDQEIEGKDGRTRSAGKVLQLKSRRKQHRAENQGHGERGSEVAPGEDKSCHQPANQDDRGERVLPIVHLAFTQVEKEREKQRKDDLGKFRGLKTHRPQVKPAVRVVTAIHKEHREQQQKLDGHRGKNHPWVSRACGNRGASGRRPRRVPPQPRQVAAAKNSCRSRSGPPP